MNFSLWLESTYDDLYQSAVDAFPLTKARQHATEPVQVGRFQLTPFVGLKTFLIRSVATNEDRQYRPTFLFKNVAYKDGPDRGLLKVRISVNEARFIEPLTTERHNVLVRCSCDDFYWRFQHWNSQDRSLYGRDRGPYESQGGPPANPKEMPGMCKHLMKMMEAMREVGLVR